MMNCISVAIFPTTTQAIIKRVVEYFYPGQGPGKFWVDIFVDNPTDYDLTLKLLHAVSLRGEDVTDDSWVRDRAEKDHCAEVLTRRIRALHETYLPINTDHIRRSVWLDRDEYRAWRGLLVKVLGDEDGIDVPFTLWDIEPLPRRTRTVLRLRLEMRAPTYDRRFADKGSFLAYGEDYVLRAVEEGLRSYNGTDAEAYNEEFANFRGGHKVSEAFEYLIVSPDKQDLRWDAVALSPLISPKFIASVDLARTTRWFATDSPYMAGWRLRGNFVVEVTRLDNPEQSRADAAPESISASAAA